MNTAPAIPPALDRPVPWLALRAQLERTLLEAIRKFYGDRLFSLVIYGSVGRGLFTLHSDLDLLIVADPLPTGRGARVREFETIEEALTSQLEASREAGWQVELSPIFRTLPELEAGSPLFLDMTQDARILEDRDDIFSRRLDRLRQRLAQLGSRRIWRHGTWYWDLKPDYQPGDRIEL